MEVLNINAGMLCNFEVLQLVREMRSAQDASGSKKISKLKTNLANITYDTQKYLQQTACASQNPEMVRIFLEGAKDLKVTKFERLQLLNLRPTTIIQLQLVLEEVEERFSEEQMQSMLDLIAELLPVTAPPVEVNEEAGPS